MVDAAPHRQCADGICHHRIGHIDNSLRRGGGIGARAAANSPIAVWAAARSSAMRPPRNQAGSIRQKEHLCISDRGLPAAPAHSRQARKPDPALCGPTLSPPPSARAIDPPLADGVQFDDRHPQDVVGNLAFGGQGHASVNHQTDIRRRSAHVDGNKVRAVQRLRNRLGGHHAASRTRSRSESAGARPERPNISPRWSASHATAPGRTGPAIDATRPDRCQSCERHRPWPPHLTFAHIRPAREISWDSTTETSGKSSLLQPAELEPLDRVLVGVKKAHRHTGDPFLCQLLRDTRHVSRIQRRLHSAIVPQSFGNRLNIFGFHQKIAPRGERLHTSRFSPRPISITSRKPSVVTSMIRSPHREDRIQPGRRSMNEKGSPGSPRSRPGPATCRPPEPWACSEPCGTGSPRWPGP